jgi:rSAM/selenodomain-associated transferase 2/rSAM/selenodomain-associated transferase 1
MNFGLSVEKSESLHHAVSVQRLIVFSRYPVPGQTKTRLIERLGADGAAEVHREMTAHTFSIAREFAARGETGLEVRFTGGSADLMSEKFGADLNYRPQAEGDLGARLSSAVDDAFAEGAGPIVLIGTDCPELDADRLDRAFRLLRTDPRLVVMGPAHDGGYYLIGMSRAAPDLFRNIAWGSEAVLAQTVETARQSGYPTTLLDPLADVDRPEDLDVWYSTRSKAGQPRCKPRCAVIIPALDEEETIGQAVDSALSAESVEVIVVDGGSRDGTIEIARTRGATVHTSSPGRARQMNAGAARANANMFLFLHADTVLPQNYDQVISEVLEQPETSAGAFRLRIDAEGLSFRLIETLVHWRSTTRQRPYGDQALFMKADVFHEVGGFPELPIMEDLELVRRLRLRGRVRIAPRCVSTSARRWRALGVWRTTLLNQFCLAAYGVGIPSSRIASWRRSHSGSRSSRSPQAAQPSEK